MRRRISSSAANSAGRFGWRRGGDRAPRQPRSTPPPRSGSGQTAVMVADKCPPDPASRASLTKVSAGAGREKQCQSDLAASHRRHDLGRKGSRRRRRDTARRGRAMKPLAAKLGREIAGRHLARSMKQRAVPGRQARRHQHRQIARHRRRRLRRCGSRRCAPPPRWLRRHKRPAVRNGSLARAKARTPLALVNNTACTPASAPPSRAAASGSGSIRSIGASSGSMPRAAQAPPPPGRVFSGRVTSAFMPPKSPGPARPSKSRPASVAERQRLARRAVARRGETRAAIGLEDRARGTASRRRRSAPAPRSACGNRRRARRERRVRRRRRSRSARDRSAASIARGALIVGANFDRDRALRRRRQNFARSAGSRSRGRRGQAASARRAPGWWRRRRRRRAS